MFKSVFNTDNRHFHQKARLHRLDNAFQRDIRWQRQDSIGEKEDAEEEREREIPLRMNIQSASSLISQAVDDHSAPCRDFLNADVDNHLRKNPRLCARFAGPQDNFTSWRGETKKPSLRFNHEPLFFSPSSQFNFLSLISLDESNRS